jgi:hypothetical protein
MGHSLSFNHSGLHLLPIRLICVGLTCVLSAQYFISQASSAPLENTAPWTPKVLKACYQDLDFECAGDEIQLALRVIDQLPKEAVLEVRSYQALIAFSYRDHQRVEQLMRELIALDPQVQLPKEAPQSMKKTLDRLRPVPFDSRLSIALIGGVTIPFDDDASAWDPGGGGGLNLGWTWRQGWRLDGSLYLQRHLSSSIYLNTLSWGYGALGVSHRWGDHLWGEVGLSLGAAYISPQGLLNLSEEWGFHLSTPVRFGAAISSSLELYLELRSTHTIVSGGDQLNWSFTIEPTLGVRWFLPTDDPPTPREAP